MAVVAQSLLPVVLLIALGAGLLRAGFYTDFFRRSLDRLTYWIALPALIVSKLAQPDFEFDAVGDLLIVIVAAMSGATLVAAVAAWLMRLPPAESGVFVQAGFRGNLAFVGLPVIIFAAGSMGQDVDLATSTALLALAPLVVVYNVGSVIALLVPHHGVSPRAVLKLLRPLVTNPLLIACVAGLLMAWAGIGLPTFVFRPLDMLGATAPPLALISLGGALVSFPVGKHLGAAVGSTMVKLVVTPLLTIVLWKWLGLSELHALVAMVYAACPTAVASFVLAGQLKGEQALAATCVVVSTMLSFASLAAVLMLMV